MQSLAEIARYRLYPPLTEPSYLVLRSRRLIFSSWAKQIENHKLRVLDVGGRYQPYRPLLDGKIANYVAVDVEKTEFVTVVADGEALPFAPESFDLVIATQVFEYFDNPHSAAKQIHSILRPGGLLFASVASFAPRFVEPERWRFTSRGVRSILAPFSTIEIVPEVRSIGGLLRTANVAANFLAHFNAARLMYNFTMCPIVNLMGLAFERLNLTSNDSFTGNYSVRASK